MIRLIKENINNGVTELIFAIPDKETHSYVVNTIVNGKLSGIVYDGIKNNLGFSITNNSSSRLNVNIRIEEEGHDVFYGRTRVMPYIEPIKEAKIRSDLEFDTGRICQFAKALFG